MFMWLHAVFLKKKQSLLRKESVREPASQGKACNTGLYVKATYDYKDL